MKNKKQIKSRERVAERGEVFTNEREVKAMCDLVSQECDRIDSRFLEPACGDGNFLAEVLTRKLNRVNQLYKKNQYDYERYSALAVSSIYGVDIMQDNTKECRKRLFDIWIKDYKDCFKTKTNKEMEECIEFILNNNILCGNALSLMCVDSEQKDTDNPIVFPEWSLINGNMFKRRDFRLDVLLKEHNDDKSYDQISIGLFDDPSDSKYWERDKDTNAIIPKPIKEYKPINFKKIKEAEEYEG